MQLTIQDAGRSSVELTDEQRRAVEWGDGPLMVLAGAGTGKTTVVVERVRHLLDWDRSLAPENILVLTYNVRAAGELAERLEAALGVQRAGRIWVHNFHSFGYRLLRNHRDELGLSRGSDLLDQVGQRLLLRSLRPQLKHFLYHPVGRYPNAVDRFADVISRAKDELVTPSDYHAFAAARRTAFDFRYGLKAYGEAAESLRRREAEDRLWQVKAVRRELSNGADAAEKVAFREARRDASGDGQATWWNQLSAEQQGIAHGLKPTYLRDAEAFEVLRLEDEAEVYELYQSELQRRGQLDFGEQMSRTIQLLLDRPNIALNYQSQFRHVLVDEFQDANMAQILLLELVGRGPDKPDNVVVVGDDDQSIYRFRGASYAAFARFRERFGKPPSWAPDRTTPAVASLPLLQNRRSTANVLAAAGRLIDHNQGRLKEGQPLRPMKAPGDRVEILYAADEADEADQVVQRIRAAFQALPEPRRWSDIAVLYRRHSHRKQILDRLRRAGIPYAVVGATGLFLQPEIRDVEAALRVLARPSDSVSFTRLMTAGPWRFDASEILRVRKLADFDGRPMFDSASGIRREEGESLFNDGTGLVIFVLAVEAVGRGIHLGDAGLRFLTTVVVSIAIGGLAGFLASRIIATVDDHLIELSISLVAAYGTYLLADSFQESGIIATVVAGVVIGNYGKDIGMSERTREALDTVWEFTAFLLSALVFLLVGLAISLPQILDASLYAFWAIVAVLVGRAISVYGLVGGASVVFQGKRVGWPLPVAWLHVMFWSGLRGAVAVALALSLPLDFPQRLLLQEITFSVVLFTLLIQGMTIELVIRRTGAGTDTPDDTPAAA